jgi:serine phosphatase RsbU (regulator of sigma subunit)
METIDWRDEEFFMAQKVLESLVSPRKYYHDGKLEIVVKMRSAHRLGGDYYGIIPSCPREGYTTVFIGDVAGRGLPASLSTVLMMILMREASSHFLSPREVLTYVNKVMINSLDPELFNTTVFLIFFDLEGDIAICARGGHEYALFCRGGECEELFPKGSLLGVLPSPAYHDQEKEVMAGDRILLFTDGLVESRDREGFSREALKDILCRARSQPAEALIDEIFSCHDAMAKEKPLEDDQALIVITYK